MRTLDSRLNELERTLNADNGQGLPVFMYMTNQSDDEQTAKAKELEAYEEYRAKNIEKYPQLESMTLDDLYKSFEGKQSQVVHICFVDYSKKEGEV